MAREINYDETTIMTADFPQIRKMGAVSPNCEATPFVFNGRLYRLENMIPESGSDPETPYCAIIRDHDSGEVLSVIGGNCYFYSLFQEDDTVFVIGTGLIDSRCTTGDTLILYESTDLLNWKSRELLKNPGWRFFNTSLTKGPEGYILAVEAGEPAEFVGVPFTVFFAVSDDMSRWSWMDYAKAYPKHRYIGGPWLKFSRGYYYLIGVTELPGLRYTNYLYRTADFETWEVGYYNPILMPDEEDRKVSAYAYGFSDEFLRRMRTGFISSNSDIDMCDWKGKTLITYNVGNQLGYGYLAEAEYDGSVDDLLESFFR